MVKGIILVTCGPIRTYHSLQHPDVSAESRGPPPLVEHHRLQHFSGEQSYMINLDKTTYLGQNPVFSCNGVVQLLCRLTSGSVNPIHTSFWS